MRYFGTYNFVGARIDGYRAPTCILTTEAAEALARVDQDLAQQGSASRSTTATARRPP